jgi:hypothetical protein
VPNERKLLAAMMSGVDVPGLAELIDEPAWMRDALCREYPEVSFVPGTGKRLEPARRVCADCLVPRRCNGYAMADDSLEGVWGGTSERERRQLRAARRVSPVVGVSGVGTRCV